jgi:hypothetical protein
MVDGDDGDWRSPGELLRKGTSKLSRFLAPLDALLLQCAPGVQALLLDRSIELGVAPSVGFVFDSGDREWMKMRDRDVLRGNEVAEANKTCTAMLSTYL